MSLKGRNAREAFTIEVITVSVGDEVLLDGKIPWWRPAIDRDPGNLAGKDLPGSIRTGSDERAQRR